MNEDRKILISFIKDEISRLSQQENICTEHLNKDKWEPIYYATEMQRIAWRKDSLLRQLERLL